MVSASEGPRDETHDRSRGPRLGILFWSRAPSGEPQGSGWPSTDQRDFRRDCVAATELRVSRAPRNTRCSEPWPRVRPSRTFLPHFFEASPAPGGTNATLSTAPRCPITLAISPGGRPARVSSRPIAAYVSRPYPQDRETSERPSLSCGTRREGSLEGRVLCLFRAGAVTAKGGRCSWGAPSDESEKQWTQGRIGRVSHMFSLAQCSLLRGSFQPPSFRFRNRSEEMRPIRPSRPSAGFDQGLRCWTRCWTHWQSHETRPCASAGSSSSSEPRTASFQLDALRPSRTR